MMDWQARLAERRKIFSEYPYGALTKPTKPPFVSFGSTVSGRFENIAPEKVSPNSTEKSQESQESQGVNPENCTQLQRERLLRAARSVGVEDRIIERLPDRELVDCEDLDPEGLAALAQAFARTDRMRHSLPPRSWTQASVCRRCGPVLLWPGAPLNVLGCPWCFIRADGIAIPRPSVSCATCNHIRPRTDSSDAGTHDCNAGHEPRHAFALHVCLGWQPHE